MGGAAGQPRGAGRDVARPRRACHSSWCCRALPRPVLPSTTSPVTTTEAGLSLGTRARAKSSKSPWRSPNSSQYLSTLVLMCRSDRCSRMVAGPELAPSSIRGLWEPARSGGARGGHRRSNAGGWCCYRGAPPFAKPERNKWARKQHAIATPAEVRPMALLATPCNLFRSTTCTELLGLPRHTIAIHHRGHPKERSAPSVLAFLFQRRSSLDDRRAAAGGVAEELRRSGWAPPSWRRVTGVPRQSA